MDGPPAGPGGREPGDGEPIASEPVASGESQVNALIAEGETGHRSPQDVVDEIHAAAEAEAGVTDGQAYGRIGRRFDRRSPFYIGLTGGLGVAVVYALGTIVLAAGQILLLIALAIVVAVGLDPPVAWLHRRGLPRWAAVAAVLAVALGVFGGFLALAVPVLVTQGTALAKDLPHYLHSLNNHSTFLGKLNARYHVVTALQKFISKGGSSAIASGVLGVGKVVVDLIPVVGSTIGGVIVALIALTVSPTVAIATLVFYFVYRFLEDYVLTPRVMARTVQVPGLLTVTATLIGGTLLGIIGALIAIPIAAAFKLLLEETTIPSLNRS